MALRQLLLLLELRNVRVMADITKVLADNLRRLRGARGLTQQELADKANLSLGTIQGYESTRRWPERPYIAVLAKALDVSETELFQENVIPTEVLNLWNSLSQSERDLIFTIFGKRFAEAKKQG